MPRGVRLCGQSASSSETSLSKRLLDTRSWICPAEMDASTRRYEFRVTWSVHFRCSSLPGVSPGDEGNPGSICYSWSRYSPIWVRPTFISVRYSRYSNKELFVFLIKFAPYPDKKCTIYFLWRSRARCQFVPISMPQEKCINLFWKYTLSRIQV